MAMACCAQFWIGPGSSRGHPA